MTNVLLVEDDDDLRDAMSVVLQDGGYRVTAVGSAEEGLAELQGRGFTVLLTDFHLPEHDGLWLVKEAGRLGLMESTEVVLVTGNQSLTGMKDLFVLLKPVSGEDLLQVVRAAERSTRTVMARRSS